MTNAETILSETSNPSARTVALVAALVAASEKAGCDVSDLRVTGCTLDRTWGDRDGLVFFGASAEKCERAAKFANAWMHANPAKSTYGSQVSLGEPVAMVRDSVGAWYSEKSLRLSRQGWASTDFSDMPHGVAVGTTYTPGCD